MAEVRGGKPFRPSLTSAAGGPSRAAAARRRPADRRATSVRLGPACPWTTSPSSWTSWRVPRPGDPDRRQRSAIRLPPAGAAARALPHVARGGVRQRRSGSPPVGDHRRLPADQHESAGLRASAHYGRSGSSGFVLARLTVGLARRSGRALLGRSPGPAPPSPGHGPARHDAAMAALAIEHGHAVHTDRD